MAHSTKHDGDAGHANDVHSSRVSEAVTPEILTSSQLHALFDILTHYETYAEIVRFKHPDTIAHNGYPFTSRPPGSDGTPTYASHLSAPLLAGLLRTLVLPIPGIRDLPAGFWYTRFQGIITKFAEAELSDSYDKGALGTRKTLATAASVVVEAVNRGTLGGVAHGPPRNLNGHYDRSKASDLARAWDDAVHELVHGSLLDELFNLASNRQCLEDHSAGIRAVADYIIIHMAAFMHHVFVISPEGPYLLKLIENVHKVIPYSAIKKTLRIGNAATMLNGMTKLLLAKVGVGALSNWVGLTRNADDGMNLLQWIISTVLTWDCAEFRKTLERIENTAQGAPSREQLLAIKGWIEKTREEHDQTRNASLSSPTSMIAAIFHNSGLQPPTSVSQHQLCQEYLNSLLALRDREEIIKVLCKQNPDLFTQAVKELVAGFEPMIRTIHDKVDLREYVSAGERFITDFINTGKPKRKESSGGISNSIKNPFKSVEAAEQDTSAVPSVEDYVHLLKRNRHLLYDWVGQVASKCPDIRDEFYAWAKETLATLFLQPHSPHGGSHEGGNSTTATESQPTNLNQRDGAAGAMNGHLQRIFAALPPDTRKDVLHAVDAHAAYISSLEDSSLKRMQHILDNSKSRPTSSSKSSHHRHSAERRGSMSGPGVFMSRWHQLMDDTIVTPDRPNGPLRQGADVKGSIAQGKVAGTAVAKGEWDPITLEKLVHIADHQPPRVEVVVEALGPAFRGLVGEVWKQRS